jgi:type IV pilus assembly protein PilO
MKLPKHYFENLTASRYKEYLKLLPDMQKENTRIITTLILTFVAMSFFGIFAINPTLSTIIVLKKQLSDSVTVHSALEQKISNLSSLQQQYTNLNTDLTNILAAVPQSPAAPTLIGKIYGLAQSTNVNIVSISVLDLQLVGESKTISDKSSYPFTLQAKGTYESLSNFIMGLPNIDRIISVESISVSKDPKQGDIFMDIKGRAYFQK